jgi:general secretion pathway protein K
LLAVLWLATALGAIAFTVATTVRTETDRTATTAEGVRAYYLASGSIDRAILWMLWGVTYNIRNPDGSVRYYAPPMPEIRYHYASGEVAVQVLPESGKLNINTASPQDIETLIENLGIDPERARELTLGIVQWRTSGAGAPPDLTSAAAVGGSSFQAPGASLEELEETLLIPGMTPDIFYGRYDHDSSGRLIPRGGLRDCLTVWGSSTTLDVNTAPPALLLSIGLPPAAVNALVARRNSAPFTSMDQVKPFIEGTDVQPGRLGIGGNSIWTLRATARPRLANGQLSDLQRSVAAVVKFLDPQKFDPPFHILRWYDDAWSPTSAPVF